MLDTASAESATDWQPDISEEQRAAVVRAVAPRYQLGAFINAGSFAAVWHATDTITGERVAIKQLASTAQARHDFYSELSLLFRLTQPHIVRVLNMIDPRQQAPCLVLEYCAGGSLRRVLRTTARWTETEALRLVRQVALGLQEAHRLGIVHRDLKPENILFAADDAGHPSTWTAKIVDFGLARRRSNTVFGVSAPGGSPAYMAPEQFADEYSPASDIYALGVILYELLHGVRPYTGSYRALARGHCYRPPDLTATLSASVRALLQRLLHKEADQRPTATELLSQLPRVAQSRSRSSHTPILLPRSGSSTDEVVAVTEGALTRYDLAGRCLQKLPVDTATTDERGNIWYTVSGELHRIAHEGTTHHVGKVPFLPDQLLVHHDADGFAFVTALKGRTITRWRFDQLDRQAWAYYLCEAPHTRLVLLKDGGVAVCLGVTGELLLLLSPTGRLAKSVHLGTPCQQLVGSTRGTLAVLLNNGTTTWPQWFDHQEDLLLPFEAYPDLQVIAMHPDGRRLTGGSRTGLVEWNAGGRIVRSEPLQEGSDTPLALLRSATTVALVQGPLGQRLWFGARRSCE